MGLFDFSNGDGGMFSNPNAMALLGLAQGLGQAAMPSRMPIPFGAALAQGLGGAVQGAQHAQQYKANQMQNDMQSMLLAYYKGMQPQGAAQGVPGSSYAASTSSPDAIPQDPSAPQMMPAPGQPPMAPRMPGQGPRQMGAVPFGIPQSGMGAISPMDMITRGQAMLGIPTLSGTGANLIATGQKMLESGMVPDGQGGVTAIPGYLGFQGQKAGTVAGAQAAAQYPYEIGKIGAQGAETRRNEQFAAGFRPMTIKVPDPNNPGLFTEVQTSAAALPGLSAQGGIAGPTAITPQMQGVYEGDRKYLNDTLQPAYEAAQQGKEQVATIMNSLQQMTQAAATTPGKYADIRISALKAYNDIIPQLGGTPLDSAELASANAMQKASTRLASAMTRQLGAREAAQIFNKMESANPNWMLDPTSNKLVANLIDQAFQRDIDRYNAGYTAAKAGGLAQDAVSNFDKKTAPGAYVNKAFTLSGINPQAPAANKTSTGINWSIAPNGNN